MKESLEKNYDANFSESYHFALVEAIITHEIQHLRIQLFAETTKKLDNARRTSRLTTAGRELNESLKNGIVM